MADTPSDPSFLPGVPAEAVRTALARSPGSELSTGKFGSPESSAALAANAFGWFLGRPGALPPLPGVPMGRASAVTVEAEMRFPWRGGTHSWLDALLTTPTTLVGIESKRYEPFRPRKASVFSEAYARDWGTGMARHEAMRRELTAGRRVYRHLDAAQLVKHAYALATQGEKQRRGVVLVYLHAAPAAWASGKPVDPAQVAAHRAEVADYAARVAGDIVAFRAVAWADLLAQWAADPVTAAHAAAITARFGPL